MNVGAWLILTLFLGQAPHSISDKAAIDAAKKAVAHQIDHALPNVSFEAWLRSVIGRRAIRTEWKVNDCGEQTGGSVDRGRDFPICAEVIVSLRGNRELSLSLAVGMMRTGLTAGQPVFFSGYLMEPGGQEKAVSKLAQVPALIGSN